jgi:hypothetical protein
VIHADEVGWRRDEREVSGLNQCALNLTGIQAIGFEYRDNIIAVAAVVKRLEEQLVHANVKLGCCR